MPKRVSTSESCWLLAPKPRHISPASSSRVCLQTYQTPAASCQSCGSLCHIGKQVPITVEIGTKLILTGEIHQKSNIFPRNPGDERHVNCYRGSLLMRNQPPLGPYSRTLPRALRKLSGGGAVSCERYTPVSEWRRPTTGGVHRFFFLSMCRFISFYGKILYNVVSKL